MQRRRWIQQVSLVPHIAGGDERALHTFLTFTKRQFIYPLSDDLIRETLVVELGPEHLDRLRALLQVADLH